MADRPTGAVTFLFTDVVGSTAAWEADPTAMNVTLEAHDRVLRSAIESNGGFVFATGGDSFSAAFSSPTSALAAAVDAQLGLTESNSAVKVRMGVHSGEAIERDGNYFGPPLNQTARLMSIGHGGQVLVSDITRGLVASARFEFLDLGEHRLADLSSPVSVAQLVANGLETEFAPLRSAVATDNIPRLAEIIGRSTDVERVSDLLVERRLVTLTGAGGIGKTTLATAVATAMVDRFPDGRWLVDLTDLPPGSDRTAIAGAVAGVDDRFSSVEALAPRQMLMILDNCEHVLDGARSYLTDLLANARDMTVLATSRESLGLTGEKIFPVAPLSVEEDSDHASAIDLFIERADEAGVALDPETDREAIAEICREVGGLPLAIELAAARTAVMNPRQILDRLSDRLSLLRGGVGGPEHHSTIEATIAWSYDLLDAGTQQLLRFLSVFEGSFELDQAEAIGGEDAMNRLTDLVRKSLVHRHGDRFGMLEAVRQYAATRLEVADEEEEARRRHFVFFAGWAHDVYHRDQWIDPTPEEFGWMTTNLQALRQAIEWGATHDEASRAAEIAAVLWTHRVGVTAGKPAPPDYYAHLLPVLDELESELQMSTLHGSASIALLSDPPRSDESRERASACYEIHKRTGLVPRTGVLPQVLMGWLSYLEEAWDDAERLYWEAFSFAEKHGLPRMQPAMHLIPLLAGIRNDPEAALDLIQQARKGDHDAPDILRYQATLEEAHLRMRLGGIEEPRRMITEVVQTLRLQGVMVYAQAWSLALLSILEYQEGHFDAAVTLLLECLDLEEAEGTRPVWQQWEALDVAELLLDLGHHGVAERVLDEYEVSPLVVQKAQAPAARLQALKDRIPEGSLGPGDELPLIEAIRRALEAANPGDRPD